MSIALLTLALLAAEPSLTREPAKKHSLLTPGEIFKRLEASERTYKLVPEKEPLFSQKKFAEAEKAYAALLAKYPGHYLAMLAWGECAEFTGNPKLALERY